MDNINFKLFMYLKLTFLCIKIHYFNGKKIGNIYYITFVYLRLNFISPKTQ